ncbi:hypothetical protein PN462_09870 [Spirulina sp. CS-785/01]|uniref:hypothetical protein n=1 Tax=Spirulina sp. CS-785/01 TaxID=3021716 RepID=UPI002331511F|nr:hypothetical protein [Spirulina sp. CS-785/01]MDB9313403.1 hypothetical protein [Spirulina sp. CS-785/01]
METTQTLIHKYKEIGFWKAGELLLKPKNALQLITELEQRRIQIFGVDLWYLQENGIVEDPNSLDLSSITDAKESAKIAKDFIQFHLPQWVIFVSLVIDD